MLKGRLFELEGLFLAEVTLQVEPLLVFKILITKYFVLDFLIRRLFIDEIDFLL